MNPEQLAQLTPAAGEERHKAAFHTAFRLGRTHRMTSLVVRAIYAGQMEYAPKIRVELLARAREDRKLKRYEFGRSPKLERLTDIVLRDLFFPRLCPTCSGHRILLYVCPTCEGTGKVRHTVEMRCRELEVSKTRYYLIVHPVYRRLLDFVDGCFVELSGV